MGYIRKKQTAYYRIALNGFLRVFWWLAVLRPCLAGQSTDTNLADESGQAEYKQFALPDTVDM